MEEEVVIKGWLTRKAGLLKTRYWFWLLEDKLMYAKTIPTCESNAKYSTVDVSSVHQVRRTDSPMSFEIVSRKEHFSLVAATQVECDDWVKNLQIAMQHRRRSSWITQTAGCSSSSESTPSDSSAGKVDSTVDKVERFENTTDITGYKAAVTMPRARSSSTTAAEPASPCRRDNEVDGESELSAGCEGNEVTVASPIKDQPTAFGRALGADSSSAQLPDPMAADLAIHVAKMKVLLHNYEEINVPVSEDRQDGNNATCADVTHRSTSVRRDQARRTLSTHEQVTLEDGEAEPGNRKKRFSIVRANPGSSGGNTVTAAAATTSTSSRGIRGPKGLNAYEEIILEGSSDNTNDVAMGISMSTSADAASADQVASQPLPVAGHAGGYQSGCSRAYEDVDLKTGREALGPPPPPPPSLPSMSDAGDHSENGSAPVYSEVKRQPAAVAGDTAALPAKQQWHSGDQGVAGGTGLASDAAELPLPCPAVLIVESEDDVYARLSEKPVNAAVAAFDTCSLLVPTAAAESLASSAGSVDATRIRAFRPQPYSHAVSALKEYLVREGAFSTYRSTPMHTKSSSSTASRLTGCLGTS